MERTTSENRRRKIAERGSERIALITSLHLNNIHEDSPSSASSSPPSQLLHTKSYPNRHEHDDDFATSELGSKEPQLRKCVTDKKAIRAPFLEVEDNLPLSPITSRVHKPSNNTEPSLKPYGIYLNLYNPKELNASIIASESTRVSCSIVIALLVVLSNISLPRNIVKSRSVIASNPLYVLLLTDVAIVIGWLTVKRRRVSEKIKEEEEEVGLKEDKDVFGGAFKILELGVVAHQTIRAIFIDFSFYAVIVVCGLSLL